MSDICESCGCPEGVDGHDVLYRRINELQEIKVGVPRLMEALASSPGAEERKTLCDRITELEGQLKDLTMRYEVLALEHQKCPGAGSCW